MEKLAERRIAKEGLLNTGHLLMIFRQRLGILTLKVFRNHTFQFSEIIMKSASTSSYFAGWKL